ncbi:MAG: hypothetical protein AAFQ89_11460 [Cyanobacteria bacterium J06626_18]
MLEHPTEAVITVLQLDRGRYIEVGRFAGSALLQSPQLNCMGIDLSLTAERILNAVK